MEISQKLKLEIFESKKGIFETKIEFFNFDFENKIEPMSYRYKGSGLGVISSGFSPLR